MPLSAGDRLGRHEILNRLGAGGMGEVYLALDPALAREVAIKVLPDRVAGDEKRLEQFRLEARAVAALSHPNILEIHDVGEDAGVHYVVTELLDGETLRERTPSSGLSWQRVVEIGVAIADALAAAHARGIVHRDLKPENVFITSTGRVKVLDFGLAQVQELAVPEAPGDVPTDIETKTAPVYGTVGYLAPELIEGARADTRSDIFALGCVLYEMVTGRRAFRSDSAPETLRASLKEEPPLPSSLGAILPREFEDTIARCLEKSPEARFQSAADLAFALRAIAGASVPRTPAQFISSKRRSRRFALAVATVIVVTATIAAVVWGPRLLSPVEDLVTELDPNRVVVVPFDNRTGDPNLDVIGLMTADWLNQGMSEIGELVPIASSSAVAAARLAAGAPFPSLEAAHLVGAGTFVAGAYHRQGDLLQIKAEIVTTATGQVLLEVDPVSGPISQPMSVVEPLRQQVLGFLAGRDPQIGGFRPPTLEAYREYVAGRRVYLEDPKAGHEHFRRACELDPDFFPPRVMSVVALRHMGRAAEASTLFEELVRHRAELSPDERLSLDSVQFYFQHRYNEMLPPIRERVERDPLNPITRSGHAEAAIWTNHPQEALETLEALDSWFEFEWIRRMRLCEALHMLGRHRRELEMARELVAGHPSFRVSAGVLARALAALGRTEELAELVRGSFPDSTSLHAWVACEASLELRAHGSPKLAREIAEREFESLQGLPIREWAVQPWQGNFGNPVSTLFPFEPPANFWLASLLLLADRPEDALASFNELAASDPSDNLARSAAVAISAMLGDRQTAVAAAQFIETSEQPNWYGAGTIVRATIAAGLGEHDEAVELLRQALAKGTQFNLHFHRNIFLEPLRGHEEFEEFLRPKG